MGFFGKMFERPAQEPSKEERDAELRQKLADLEQQRTEIEFYMEHRERDSYLVGQSDADRLANIEGQIKELKQELEEPETSEAEQEDENSKQKAA